MIAARALALAVVVAACTERVQLGPDGMPADAGALPGLRALRITPAHTDVAQVDRAPHVVTLVATGTFDDGERDVTSLVDWSVDDPWAGGMTAPGVFATTGRAGGAVTVEAHSGPLHASAAIDVVYAATITDSIFPPPAGAEGRFGPDVMVIAGDPTHAPLVVYPANETRIPPNLARMLLQYTPGDANDVFRLAFDGPHLHLVVFTAATRWQPDADTWTAIARSSAGERVTLAVTGAPAATPGPAYAAAPLAIDLASADAPGALSYFSTAGPAIFRAGVAATSPQRFYTTPPDATCTGCHAISRDGRRVALGYGGETLQVIDADRAVLVGTTPKIPMGFATFSPDGALLLVADKGKLALVDVAARTSHPVMLPAGTLATHPDWSPDGASVVVAIGTTVGNKNMSGGRIARLPWNGATFGPPETLVPSSGANDNNFYPRWSPDGAWIAFVHAAGPSDQAPSAELRLVSAAGGAPIALVRANQRIGPADGVVDVGNSMPTWSPPAADGSLWLAFSSRRAYGAVSAGGMLDQIWITAIDPAALAAGADPSSPAFWLPAQDVTVVNDQPVWAVGDGLQ